MHIDWWTLALQAINVLILVWLLSRFLYRPVMTIIADRQAMANALLSDAWAAKDAVEAEEAALKAQNDAFTVDADRRRTQMQAQIDEERVRLLGQARTDASAVALQVTAAAEVDQARKVEEWQAKAGILAGSMTQALLERLPASQTTDAMFEALIERLRSLSDTERHKLAEDTPLVILTPSAIKGPDQARYLDALKDLLPTKALAFSVDPGLIAGFEIRGPHIRVANSWRADLDGMLSALKEDGHARFA